MVAPQSVPENESSSIDESITRTDVAVYNGSYKSSIRWKDDDAGYDGDSARSSNPSSSLRSTPGSSIRSNVSLSRHSNPSLHDNLMRRRKQRNPHDYFEVVEVLGVGSMGSVSKVKKKSSAVGGSARKEYVDSEHAGAIEMCFNVPLIGSFFKICAGKIREKKKQDLLKAPEITNKPEYLRMQSSFVRDVHEDIYYALKSIHLDCLTDDSYLTELRNEVEILTTIDHPNIVRPIETFEHRNQMYILMELCSGGDLYTRDPYSEAEAAAIVSSILSAVSYMHSHNISHRDLKYENIVFSNDSLDSEIKIIDFGLSKTYGNAQERMKGTVGTVYTMAPEVLKNNYTCKADLWSVGVIAFMLLSSSMPFYGKKRRHVMEKILKCQYSFKGRVWKRISPEAKRFVMDLLQLDPDDRPTAAEAAQSPWLRNEIENGGEALEIKRMDAVQATLQNFGEYGTLKKLALMVVAHKSTSEEIGFLRTIFQKYDTLRNGIISLPEFKEALMPYGYSNEEMEIMFEGMDLDGTGIVHYTEFLAATIEAHGNITEERLAEAFDRLDSDDSGYITGKNLFDFLGISMPKDYIDQIIDEADLKRDHRISYEEFLELWSDKYETQRRNRVQIVEQRRLIHSGSNLTDTTGHSPRSSEGLSSDFSVSSDEERGHHKGMFQFHAEKAQSVRGPRVFDM